jgi:LemA protein
MKKGCLIALGVALLLALAVGGCGVSQYNGLVTKDTTIEAKWAEIQNQYKRRFDLIPQLVDTVKGARDFEQSTLLAVTEARASVGRITLPESVATDPALLKQYVAAQDALGSALQRLLVVSENYPELKSSQNFLSLQDQVEGTENRLAVARRDYIDAVNAYDVAIRRFPASLLAGMFGFEKKPQLELAEPGMTERPAIDFGDQR